MTAKEYLNQARHLDELIHCRLREIDYWRDLSSNVSSSSFEEHYNSNRSTEAPFDRLRRIVENKGELFKAAFKTDNLEILVEEDKVCFPWFTVEECDDTSAYCIFISMLCEFAKNQSRINNKPDTSDNPKYAMRCYLLRLGMIGAEYKAARKVLLRNLSGSSAFRKVGDSDEISE